MSVNPDFQKLRELVANNRIQAVLDQLIPYVSHLADAALRNELYLLSAKWKEFEPHARMKSRSGEQISVERTQMTIHLLQLLDKIESEIAVSDPSSRQLHLQIKCNKTGDNLRFAAGEEVQFYFLVNRPYILRMIYQLVSKQYVLLDNDRKVSQGETNRWIALSNSFTVEAPFGNEALHLFAKEGDFLPVLTEADTEGYEVIVDGLPNILTRSGTRGLKKKEVMAHSSLILHTYE